MAHRALPSCAVARFRSLIALFDPQNLQPHHAALGRLQLDEITHTHAAALAAACLELLAMLGVDMPPFAAAGAQLPTSVVSPRARGSNAGTAPEAVADASPGVCTVDEVAVPAAGLHSLHLSPLSRRSDSDATLASANDGGGEHHEVPRDSDDDVDCGASSLTAASGGATTSGLPFHCPFAPACAQEFTSEDELKHHTRDDHSVFATASAVQQVQASLDAGREVVSSNTEADGGGAVDPGAVRTSDVAPGALSATARDAETGAAGVAPLAVAPAVMTAVVAPGVHTQPVVLAHTGTPGGGGVVVANPQLVTAAWPSGLPAYNSSQGLMLTYPTGGGGGGMAVVPRYHFTPASVLPQLQARPAAAQGTPGEYRHLAPAYASYNGAAPFTYRVTTMPLAPLAVAAAAPGPASAPPAANGGASASASDGGGAGQATGSAARTGIAVGVSHRHQQQQQHAPAQRHTPESRPAHASASHAHVVPPPSAGDQFQFPPAVALGVPPFLAAPVTRTATPLVAYSTNGTMPAAGLFGSVGAAGASPSASTNPPQAPQPPSGGRAGVDYTGLDLDTLQLLEHAEAAASAARARYQNRRHGRGNPTANLARAAGNHSGGGAGVASPTPAVGVDGVDNTMRDDTDSDGLNDA